MQLCFFDSDKYRMLSGKQPEQEKNGRGCGETMPQVFPFVLWRGLAVIVFRFLPAEDKIPFLKSEPF